MQKPEDIDPALFSRKISSKEEFKREKERLEYEAYKSHVLQTTRPIDNDLLLRGIGSLRIQILYCPSFERELLWDIREQVVDNKRLYEVYENELESLTTILPGYKKLVVQENPIARLMDAISTTLIPLRLETSTQHGLDGTLYGLTIYNNPFRQIRLRWWEKPAPELMQLHEVVKTTIHAFKHTLEKIAVV